MKNLFRKTMITMCSAVMLMGIGAVSANAASTTVGDFTVDRSKSGYSSPYVVSISAYNGKGGEITLPTTAEINGTEYPITSVGNAFEGNESITGRHDSGRIYGNRTQCVQGLYGTAKR